MPQILRLVPDKSVARSMGALLSNTASPTVLSAGAKINVIPEKAEVEIAVNRYGAWERRQLTKRRHPRPEIPAFLLAERHVEMARMEDAA